MNTSDELRVVLDDTTQDMAQVVPDPGEWSKFIIYFLEELEDKTEDRAGFFKMLLEVQDYLSKRIRGGITCNTYKIYSGLLIAIRCLLGRISDSS